MAVITDVERKSPYFRGILIFIYSVLALGAVTMVYPFLLMLSHSVCSNADADQFRIIPRYWYSDHALFVKYAADKYNPRFINYFNAQFGTVYEHYSDLPMPEPVPTPLLEAWNTFRKDLPQAFLRPGFTSDDFRSFPGETYRLWHGDLKNRYGTVAALSRAHKRYYSGFLGVFMPPDNRHLRNWYPPHTAAYRDWTEFKKELPPRFLFPVSGRAIWINMLRNRYMQDIDRVNRAHGTSHASFDDIRLPVTCPAPGSPLRRDWSYLVRNIWPFRFMEVDTVYLPRYRNVLRGLYGTVAAYNRTHGTSHRTFDSIVYPASFEHDGPHIADWTEFIETAPDTAIRLLTVEQMYRDHLQRTFGSVGNLNQEAGTAFRSFQNILPPFLASDWSDMMERRSTLRISYMVRNYGYVMQKIFFNGRALMVTLIFLSLVIIGQLIFNTSCAYALSRFRPPFTYQVLLVLLATMAFPAEVTMIPNFLNIRWFGMLNTYGALVLPMLANGFFIFILKEHFDTMPRELFEAAGIDGAGELTIMFRIIMPLSRPVQAWMVLNTFTLAYGSFMFAMVVCQDSKMWTLMVWLYQMRNWAPTYMVAAGMTIAAIPSLIVFLFCQRIIMRGMVLPVAH